MITITATTPNPPLQLADGDVVTYRAWYTNSFVASDGVTPIEGGDGRSGFFYEYDCTINGDGNVVIPAQSVQPTTGSNPTAGFFGQLFVNGAPGQMVFGYPQATAGWQIPTSPTTTNFGALALYNAAVQLLYPPVTYATYEQVLLAIQEFAGNFLYAAVGINGIGQPSVPPAIASAPIFWGINDPAVGDMHGSLTTSSVPYATNVHELGDSLFTFDGTDSGCQTLNYFQAGDYQFIGSGTRLEVNDTFSTATLLAGGNNQNSYAGIVGQCNPDTSAAQVFIQSTGYTQFYGDQTGVAVMGDTQSDHNGTIVTVDDANQLIKLTNVPTSDPEVVGAIWNDAGTLKISAG